MKHIAKILIVVMAIVSLCSIAFAGEETVEDKGNTKTIIEFRNVPWGKD